MGRSCRLSCRLTPMQPEESIDAVGASPAAASAAAVADDALPRKLQRHNAPHAVQKPPAAAASALQRRPSAARGAAARVVPGAAARAGGAAAVALSRPEAASQEETWPPLPQRCVQLLPPAFQPTARFAGLAPEQRRAECYWLERPVERNHPAVQHTVRIRTFLRWLPVSSLRCYQECSPWRHIWQQPAEQIWRSVRHHT